MNNNFENLYFQHGEELIIREFFHDRRNGNYVDIGAAWGDRASTTFYLERELHWRGIGVDALAFYGKTWKEARPDSTFLNYAVSDTGGELVDFYQAYIPAISSMHPEMLEHWGYPVEKAKTRQVETIRLDDLLKDHRIEKIDFLSTDAEGSEPQVLKGFTLARYRPELICIERWPKDEIQQFILGYFESGGYRKMQEYEERDTINWYFCQA